MSAKSHRFDIRVKTPVMIAIGKRGCLSSLLEKMSIKVWRAGMVQAQSASGAISESTSKKV